MNLDRSILTGRDVGPDLARMGLSEEQLRRAVRRGYAAREACSGNHAKTAAGTFMYHETVRGLRDELAPDWTPDSTNNVEKTVSPDKKMAIVVWAGNRDTGLEYRTPTSMRSRGDATLRDVEDNLQGNLFGEETKPDPDSQVTWVLLHYIDEFLGEIRLELSVPLLADNKQVVRRWGPRRILAAIPITDQVLTTHNDIDNEEYDVPVRRRSS